MDEQTRALVERYRELLKTNTEAAKVLLARHSYNEDFVREAEKIKPK